VYDVSPLFLKRSYESSYYLQHNGDSNSFAMMLACVRDVAMWQSRVWKCIIKIPLEEELNPGKLLRNIFALFELQAFKTRW
jgi:hypothetical protein